MILTALLAITGPFLGDHGWLFFAAFVVGGPILLDFVWTKLRGAGR